VKCTVTRSYSVCVKLKSGVGRTAYVHLYFLRSLSNDWMC